MTRLKETYQKEIVKGMTDKFGYKNVMQVPKLAKIVINMGIGEAKENSKVLDAAVAELEIIAGQKVVTTRLKTQLLTSRSEKACLSDVKLHSAATRCMSS